MIFFIHSGVYAPAQEETPTPTPETNDRLARSFLFYPADTGFLTAFEPTIEAGTTAELTILIGNNGSVTQDLRVYAVNVFTGRAGGMIADEYGAEPNPVTLWVDFPEDIVTLEPGSGIERTFTVTVPEGTRPGEYIAAVAGEHAESIAAGENFRQRLRYVTPIFITVPGEMTAEFSFGEVTASLAEDTLLIETPIINSGDVHLRPEGTIVVRDAEDNIVLTQWLQMLPIYARDQAVLSIGIQGGLPAGAYQVEIDFTDPATGASAGVDNPTIETQPVATPVPSTFSIAAGSVAPLPTADNVQFVTIDATIHNRGEPVTGVQLSLLAKLDGEEVERYPINQSLALATGDTAISARYIPATGWISGVWSFELLLEVVEPSGAAVVAARLLLDERIEIP